MQNFWTKVRNVCPSLTSLSQILQNSFKEIYRDQKPIKGSKRRTINFLKKKICFGHLSKMWKLTDPCDVINSKLELIGPNFVYYIPTVTKKSNPKARFIDISNSFLGSVSLKS